MHLLHKTEPVVTAPQISQQSGDRSLADDIRQAIDRCSHALQDSIREKPERKQSKNDTDSLHPHACGTRAYPHDPEDLRALREWVETKRIYERQVEPASVKSPTPPWHNG